MESNEGTPESVKKHEGEGDGQKNHEHKNHLVAVFVNGHPVNLLGHQETGVEIKTAAIEQGVNIQLDFVLEEELPDGSRRIVANHERVQLRENMRFSAHEPLVTVSVNEQPVTLQGHTATGLGIKEAAMAQGVLIQLNFVLQEELPNGTSRIEGDNDRVHLRQHLRFTAIAPDDNS